MKKTYFKTHIAFLRYLFDLSLQNDVTITLGTVTCAGGETNGAHVYRRGVIFEKVILDEAEYDNASNFDKGE
jgi:hypothetical protein